VLLINIMWFNIIISYLGHRLSPRQTGVQQATAMCQASRPGHPARSGHPAPQCSDPPTPVLTETARVLKVRLAVSTSYKPPSPPRLSLQKRSTATPSPLYRPQPWPNPHGFSFRAQYAVETSHYPPTWHWKWPCCSCAGRRGRIGRRLWCSHRTGKVLEALEQDGGGGG
jgi:hypothetical protein